MFRALHWSSLLTCTLVLTLAACCAMAAPAPRTPVAPATVGIGVVDLDQIAKNYVGYKTAMQRLDKFTRERAERFEALKGGVGLNADDFAEYQQLAGGLVKINPTRISELEALAAKNLAEFQRLRAADALTYTTDEKVLCEQLETNMKAASARINETGAKLTREIDEEQARYTEILIGVMNETMGKVAEGKKLSIVLSRAAQVENGSERLVLWGGTDITDDVIKILNQEFKESLFDQQ